MPSAFPFHVSPFDCLTDTEQTLVRSHVDIVYYPTGQMILDLGDEPQSLFVIIKGFVEQKEEEDVIGVFGPEDCFDARGLITANVSHRFVSAEEVIAYQLPKKIVQELISSNPGFGALLFSELSEKLSAIAQRRDRHEFNSLTLARVAEAYMHPVVSIDAVTDIVTVVRTLQMHKSSHVLVHDYETMPNRIGIFTTTDLQRAILDGTPLHQLPVGRLARFNLVTINAQDYLFDALLLMLRHDIHRVVVQEDDRFIGILEELDILSFLSNHSYLLSMEISEAQSIEDLERPAAQIPKLISFLYDGGTRVESIAQLVGEINAKLFDRTWQLIASPEIRQASCLFVMGSEGRGEQLLRTDQDNGVIFEDGFEITSEVIETCQRFSEALGRFGYPECPGGVMVSRPEWRDTVSVFSERVKDWIWHPTGDSLLSLAIFMDARAVSGDPALLERVRQSALNALTGDAGLLARFAQSVNAFSTEGSWWSRLVGRSKEETLDLKKSAIFPIVQGIRSLALEAKFPDTSTLKRIDHLRMEGKISDALAADLKESLHVLMGLKLKAGLNAIKRSRMPSNEILLHEMTTLERDLLKDTLAIVKHFKTWVSHHFRLESLG